MTTVPLREFVSGTLDGSGAGTIRIGPRGHGQIWSPQVVSIRMTGSTPSGLATCYVYAGNIVSDAYFVDATYNVNNDSTGNIAGSTLTLGQYVWAVWSGGNPGATASMIVTGTQDIP